MLLEELTSFVRTTDAVSEPITLTEAKDQLRETGSTEDTFINTLIKTARQFAEDKTGRALITQTWKATLDNGSLPTDSIIELPRPPLQSVTAVTYVDSDGATQTLSTDNYTVDTLSEPGRIMFEDMPTIKSTINALTVEYVAGYTDTSEVPSGIKQGILILVEHWFDFREAVVAGTITSKIPISADDLLDMNRIHWL
tara:strand:- start:11860 stop:12450 length:591 start_codon:yes stop_codon:yes gene_type:complete